MEFDGAIIVFLDFSLDFIQRYVKELFASIHQIYALLIKPVM